MRHLFACEFIWHKANRAETHWRKAKCGKYSAPSLSHVRSYLECEQTYAFAAKIRLAHPPRQPGRTPPTIGPWPIFKDQPDFHRKIARTPDSPLQSVL